MRLGSGEDKFNMFGWLFEGLEERVKRLVGQLMYLIDDLNLMTAFGRAILDTFNNLPHLVNAPVRCTIDFDHIHSVATSDFCTVLTLIAWGRSRTGKTVERFSKKAGGRGLSHSTSTRKEESVGHSPGGNSIL